MFLLFCTKYQLAISQVAGPGVGDSEVGLGIVGGVDGLRVGDVVGLTVVGENIGLVVGRTVLFVEK